MVDNQEVDAKLLSGQANKSRVLIEGLDRSKIDEIIREASKGSKYYLHQQKREQRISERVKTLRKKKEHLDIDTCAVQKAMTKMNKWLTEAEYGRDLTRTFFHVDMDAFFAAVEMLKRPEMMTRPIAVDDNSMLCTANYEARRFGVASAMPGYIAKKLCPQIVILPPDFNSYKSASKKVYDVLRRYDPNFRSFSLDEASLDVTDYLRSNEKEAEIVAEELRREVYEMTRLTCSVGSASNRQLAKMCSNQSKPNGQFCLSPDRDQIIEFIRRQPAKRISGVGKVTAKILEDLLEIKTCADIIDQAVWIKLLFSKAQSRLLTLSALGLGNGFGESTGNRNRKSISAEKTFKTTASTNEMQQILKSLCERLALDAEEQGLAGRTIGIKLKTSSFDVQTRVITIKRPITLADDLYKYASQLLAKRLPSDLRLLGVRLSGLIDPDEAGELKYKRLDEFANKSIPPQEKPKCPIYDDTIPAHPDDILRINEHVDGCLNWPAHRSVTSFQSDNMKKKNTLDGFFNCRKNKEIV